MYRIIAMSVQIFLNQKFLEWQVQQGTRKTISEFARLFGASQPVMSQWMSGERAPSQEFKNRIIERYGEEALVAFGEDPDLYYIQSNWQDYTPEKRKALRQQAEQLASKNGKRK